ncbi:MAG: hypothetical protein LBG76_04785 [Treponema sp.]|nr:hypothetical protein [Treponema sp.]
MRLSETQIKKLLEYPGRIRIKQLALSMAVTKFKRLYQTDAGLELVSQCAAELNLMFERFPTNMKPDYEWITRL